MKTEKEIRVVLEAVEEVITYRTHQLTSPDEKWIKMRKILGDTNISFYLQKEIDRLRKEKEFLLWILEEEQNGK